MKYHQSVYDMWGTYLNTLSETAEGSKRRYTSYCFCNNEKDADAMAVLVKEGIKRGTTSLNYWYKRENEPLPRIGDLSIITDWAGVAQCIIRTKKVSVVAFKDVSDDMARIEGEGDGSLSYWKEAHTTVFEKEFESLGMKFSPAAEVVFEEFEVVFQP